MNAHDNHQFDVAQLAHVELFTPKPDETLGFFHDLLGMEITAREGQSVYMRAYEDFYHHTLKITEAKHPGMGHVAWRAASPAALERRVAALKAVGAGQGWVKDLGHGDAFRFLTPDGHVNEILWDVEYYVCPPEKKTPLLNRPQRKPNRGVPVRRIDHVNLLTSDVTVNSQFMMDHLGFLKRENIMLDNGAEAGAWMSVSPNVHEIAMMGDRTGAKGRLHHVCYFYGTPQHLMDVADLMVEAGNVGFEAGPAKHGVSQALFLYVFEPGGNRIELFGDTGYQIFDPAWKTVTWHESELAKGIIWVGADLPSEFFIYGTPSPEVATANARELVSGDD
jgi:catechol 2,3-dioxygenase